MLDQSCEVGVAWRGLSGMLLFSKYGLVSVSRKPAFRCVRTDSCVYILRSPDELPVLLLNGAILFQLLCLLPLMVGSAAAVSNDLL